MKDFAFSLSVCEVSLFLCEFNYLLLSAAESTTIHLKVAKVQPEPGRVEDYHVPVVIYPDYILTEHTISLWDLTTQQVLFSYFYSKFTQN